MSLRRTTAIIGNLTIEYFSIKCLIAVKFNLKFQNAKNRLDLV